MICCGNPHNQYAIVCHCSTDRGDVAACPMPYVRPHACVSVTQDQLGTKMKSAKTLTELFDQNKDLLTEVRL